jgi:hypothetical protein
MKAAETQRAKLIDLSCKPKWAVPSSYMDWESRLRSYCLLGKPASHACGEIAY